MVTKIHRDALRSDIQSVKALLERSGDRDRLSAMSLRKRLEGLEAELGEVETEAQTAADVALVFDGGPVRGSSAIDADFAGKVLQDYQELITKHVAATDGALPGRGPLQQQVHEQARMNVTALVHGSFGFVLQEDRANEPQLFESATRRAVAEVSNLLADVIAPDSAGFEARLQDVDVRIFLALRRFVGHLHRAESTLRVAEQSRELKLDRTSVERAYGRLQETEVEEVEESIFGELLGLVPIQRRFEFRSQESGEILQGRVSANLSADYLERIEREEIIGGRGWRALIRTKVVQYPDQRHATTTRTLIDLMPINPGEIDR